MTSLSVTWRHLKKVQFSKIHIAIKLKPCMYSCRDVLHPKYGILKTLNRLLFNENDKQFQCRYALLHNHTTFMCKSNYMQHNHKLMQHNHIWSWSSDRSRLGHVTMTSLSVTWRHLKKVQFSKIHIAIKLKPCMYSCRDVLHPKYGILKTLNRLLFNENDKQFQCRYALLHNHTTFMCKSNYMQHNHKLMQHNHIWSWSSDRSRLGHVTMTSLSVTWRHLKKVQFSKIHIAIKLKPCMYSCRDVLHPKYGILKTLNRLLFNENDKQFQCRYALLHNHTTFMCKSNHTDECNTITSEVVSMIKTLSDLFHLNIKWVANRILCRQRFQNFEEKNRNSSVFRSRTNTQL